MFRIQVRAEVAKFENQGVFRIQVRAEVAELTERDLFNFSRNEREEWGRRSRSPLVGAALPLPRRWIRQLSRKASKAMLVLVVSEGFSDKYTR